MQFPAYEAHFIFSPDSHVLALSSPKGKVLFFDGLTGKHLATQAAEDEAIRNLGYSDDGIFLIAITHSKAFLFDAIRFERLAEVPFDVTQLWRYRSGMPGGMEKLLSLFRPATLPKVELEVCWKRLDSPQPKEVLEAMWQLSAAADVGSFLRKKIEPVAAPNGEAIRKLIRDLDNARFATRDAASRKLGELGQPVEPFLRAALKAGMSPEAAERIERIIAGLQHPPTPEEVRQRRVIFASETNGTPEAHRTLEAWAAGAAGRI